METGIAAAEARRLARQNFGAMEPIKEAWRDQRRLPMIEVLLRDIVDALRTMKRKPAFHLVVLLTFALGIGVNTAVFSIVDAVLLRPLPFPNSSELVRAGFRDARTGEPLLEASA